MLSKIPSYLYQKKIKMNVTFTREFFTVSFFGWTLFLEVSCFIVDNQSAFCYYSSKIRINYGGQAEAYLEPSRQPTMELFCKNS